MISLWFMSRSTTRRAKQFTPLFTFNLISHVAFFERCPQQAILLLLKTSLYFFLILLLRAGVIGLPSSEKPCNVKKLNDVKLLPRWVTMEMQQLYLFFIAYQINLKYCSILFWLRYQILVKTKKWTVSLLIGKFFPNDLANSSLSCCSNLKKHFCVKLSIKYLFYRNNEIATYHYQINSSLKYFWWNFILC